MAYSTISKPSLYFNTKLYTGNGATSSAGSTARTLTGVGFQPDWVWVKERSNTEQHFLQDAVRGASKVLASNTTAAEADVLTGYSDGGINGFVSDGFTLGSGTGGNANNINTNNETYVAWNWKAGTTGSGNTTGSGTYKTYNYSVNTTAGFSIIKFQGNGTAGHTIPHHLGVAPDLVFLKNLGTTNNWYVWGSEATGIAANQQLELDNTTAAYNPNGNYHNDTRPTSSVITLGDDGGSNGNNNNIIIYAFASKKGYSKIGSYVGNGNVDGTFVYTGFKPAFVMLKEISNADNWLIMDNKRLGYNPRNELLFPNLSNAEQAHDRIDLVSNGFKMNNDDGSINTSGATYVYMAFAAEPLVANVGASIPATAR